MISVVIPTLNAVQALPSLLDDLEPARASGFVSEVVVGDGGSGDGTDALAEARGCVLVRAAPGRGGQLRAACEAARANWFLILHADSRLDPAWRGAVEAHLRRRSGTAGWFELRFDDPSRTARLWERGVALRSRLGLPYGDQGLLIARSLYDAAGGYPDQPLLEDVALARAIGRSRLRSLGCPIVTSAERYRRDGWARRSLRNWSLVARFALGVSPHRLAGLYD